MASERTFHCFPQLPKELQTAIWKFASEERPVIRHNFFTILKSVPWEEEETYGVYRAYSHQQCDLVDTTVERYKSGQLLPWESMVHLPQSVVVPENTCAVEKCRMMFKRPSRPVPIKVDLDRDIFTFIPLVFFGRQDIAGFAKDKWMQFLCGPLSSATLDPTNTQPDHWFLRIKNLAIAVDPDEPVPLSPEDRRVLQRMTSLKTVLLTVQGAYTSVYRLAKVRRGESTWVPKSRLVIKDTCLRGTCDRYIPFDVLTPRIQRLVLQMADPLRLAVLDALQHLPRVEIQVVWEY